jgi:hypothetical protein
MTLFALVLRSLIPIGTLTTVTIGALFLYQPSLPYFVINEFAEWDLNSN